MVARDKSGYVVFSRGDVGAAHVMAHELLDAGQAALGHERLGRWLRGRNGSGSDWSHIQFHMAVFELELGDVKAAYARFREELLPIAAATQDALTDAPALAWRLLLHPACREKLPWETLRSTALASLGRTADPFVEVHNLLALAGARDAEGIDAWLEDHPGDADAGPRNVLVRMGEALAAYARKNYRLAARQLDAVVPELPTIGGSHAQNTLFTGFQARLAA